MKTEKMVYYIYKYMVIWPNETNRSVTVDIGESAATNKFCSIFQVFFFNRKICSTYSVSFMLPLSYFLSLARGNDPS